ncbi:MAG: S53 family peptidase [Acidimicrobiaceae bacterium]|nr:S53 family peptidase [Acidimicrobiaceae bacterium]
MAYGIQPLLDRGLTGKGETVVLLETAANPAPPPAVTDLRQDLARFDSIFDLPTARLRVENSIAGVPSTWLADTVEAADVEEVHAIAPGASVLVILIDAGNLIADLPGALRLGVSQGAVMSISRGYGEHCYTRSQVTALDGELQEARDHRVTVVAFSGDTGAAGERCAAAGPFQKEPWLPAADPLVLAVGGTRLAADRTTGGYVGETAWNDPPGPTTAQHSLASGGGFSNLFPRPGYQDGVVGTGATRGVPDVAADADPSTGMAVAGIEGGQEYGGTISSLALWVGLVALADQYAHHQLGFLNASIYRIGLSTSYRAAFHDITTGDNSVQGYSQAMVGYQAQSSWDPVTGWGSPNAQALIPLLTRSSPSPST